MSYCVNSSCTHPQNLENAKFCITCGSLLILKDRYRPILPIGQGGFGRTFLAQDEDIPSRPQCVIKQLSLEAFQADTREKAIALFQQEAVRLDQLGKHPQIPHLLASFEYQQQLYLVQEFVAGETLKQELRRTGNFTEEKVWQVLREMIPILKFVHQNQVIHRDIKPDNIMRRKLDQKLILIDFGIAKKFTSLTRVQTGTIVGSPEYIAPEQLKGKAVPASDLYSLGVTCIHLLTNLNSPLDLYNAMTQTWEWKDYLVPENPVSDRLKRILDKLIQNSLTVRYQMAEDVEPALGFRPQIPLPLSSQPTELMSSPPGQVTSPSQPLKPRVSTTQPTQPTGVRSQPLQAIVNWGKQWLQSATGSSGIISEIGVNYSQLEQCLTLGKWKVADEETWRVFCQALGKSPRSYLFIQDWGKIPCQDLMIIDHLWMRASQSKFGFTPQFQIYQEVGEEYVKFCDRVGWSMANPVANLKYSLSSPPGHLPSRLGAGGTQVWRHTKAIADQLIACGIV